ncbi:Protein of unknown function [Gryllus bimaculatus]|nr:Protein of unknown function [Gryllus bimaculatus]
MFKRAVYSIKRFPRFFQKFAARWEIGGAQRSIVAWAAFAGSPAATCVIASAISRGGATRRSDAAQRAERRLRVDCAHKSERRGAGAPFTMRPPVAPPLPLALLTAGALMAAAPTPGARAARILALFPTPSISHQLPFQVVMKELAARGHQVTVISTDPLKLRHTTEREDRRHGGHERREANGSFPASHARNRRRPADVPADTGLSQEQRIARLRPGVPGMADVPIVFRHSTRSGVPSSGNSSAEAFRCSASICVRDRAQHEFADIVQPLALRLSARSAAQRGATDRAARAGRDTPPSQTCRACWTARSKESSTSAWAPTS